MTTKISVAMATYNGEKYIKEQLDSLVKQTVLPYEMVVCDDCSKDATVKLIKDFAESAPFRVRLYINESNLGYSDNFLKVAALCKGDWIAFCDQDDVWLPNKLERVSGAIEGCSGDEVMLVTHSSLITNSKLEPTGKSLRDYQRDARVKIGSKFGFYGEPGHTLLFRATLSIYLDSRLRSRFFRQENPPIGHDEFVPTLANALGDIVYISEPLTLWRRHEHAQTRPLKNWNIMSKTRNAISVATPDPYFAQANKAAETAAAFRGFAGITENEKIKDRLLKAASDFDKLSRSSDARGELYKAQKYLQKIRAFVKLMSTNSYFGRTFCALGWKSFLKDLTFALGLIGQTKG